MSKPLKCRLGSHNWGPWTWDTPPPEDPHHEWIPMQRRCCQDCLQVQGPIVSSEERMYFESWKDRGPNADLTLGFRHD